MTSSLIWGPKRRPLLLRFIEIIQQIGCVEFNCWIFTSPFFYNCCLPLVSPSYRSTLRWDVFSSIRRSSRTSKLLSWSQKLNTNQLYYWTREKYTVVIALSRFQQTWESTRFPSMYRSFSKVFAPPPPRAIIPYARPLGTSKNQDGRH